MSMEILTIEEVAALLRVSERTVYEWANKGEIPCGKLGTSWRFKRSEIEKWVDSRLGSEQKGRGDFVPLFIDRLLSPDHIMVVESISKNELLQAMVEMISSSPNVKSRKELEAGIFHREQLMSTGIGMGIGIPHVRNNSVKDVVLGAALVRNGVDGYESLDSQPVKLVFLIAARSDQHSEHLKLLSQISSKLKDASVREALCNAADAADFYRLLTGEEG